jgi:RNA polymerase sigma-70 factor (ECF subfamily)
VVVGRPLKPESELIEQARQGDTDAYTELVRRHQQVAFRTAYVILRSPGEAEEAAQDAFLKAYRALGRFRPGAEFRPWLLRIVANEARNRRRAIGRRLRLRDRAAAEVPSGGAASSPEAELVAREERARLLAAIDRLSDDERVAVIGRYFIGLTDEETAAVLGVPRGTVKMRVWRGVQHLREQLEGQSG